MKKCLLDASTTVSQKSSSDSSQISSKEKPDILNATLAVDSSNNILYVGTRSGIYSTGDYGVTYTQKNTGLSNINIQCLAINTITNTLVAGTSSGGFRSSNGGTSWTSIGSLSSISIQALTFDISSSSTVYAGTPSAGIYKSTNSGTSWTQSNTGLSTLNVKCILSVGSNTIYVGTTGGGVFKSTNNGSTWTAVNTGLTTVNIQCLVNNGIYIHFCYFIAPNSNSLYIQFN